MVQTTFQSDVFKALVLFDQQCKICRNVLAFNCVFLKSTVVLSLKVFKSILFLKQWCRNWTMYEKEKAGCFEKVHVDWHLAINDKPACFDMWANSCLAAICHGACGNCCRLPWLTPSQCDSLCCVILLPLLPSLILPPCSKEKPGEQLQSTRVQYQSVTVIWYFW